MAVTPHPRRPSWRWLAPVLVLACSRAAPADVRPPPSAPPASAPAAANDAPGARVRIVSFNVNYGVADDPEIAAIVREWGADLVLLQETTRASERALRHALGEAYPHWFFEHRPLAGGMGVGSRLPLRDRRVVDPAAGGWFPAIRVVAATPIGELEALDVHLHPQVSESGSVLAGIFTTSGIREGEARALLPLLAPDLPTIVAGDFNEGPRGDAVVLFERAGLTRAATKGPTWRWQTSLGEVHATLDHVLVDGELEVVQAARLERGASDHYPLFVELRRRRGSPGS